MLDVGCLFPRLRRAPRRVHQALGLLRGDGVIDATFGEQCDDGKNDGSYGGCNADCRLGPRCGDGIKNGSETDVDCGGADCPRCAAAALAGVVGSFAEVGVAAARSVVEIAAFRESSLVALEAVLADVEPPPPTFAARFAVQYVAHPHPPVRPRRRRHPRPHPLRHPAGI